MFDSYKDYGSMPTSKMKIIKNEYKKASKEELKKIREEIKHENNLLIRKQILITIITIIIIAIVIIIFI